MDPFLPAPQPERWRRGVYVACAVIIFSALQLWAVVVLLSTASLHGPLGWAFLVTVIGSLTSVFIGWRWTVRLSREPVRREPARREPPMIYALSRR